MNPADFPSAALSGHSWPSPFAALPLVLAGCCGAARGPEPRTRCAAGTHRLTWGPAGSSRAVCVRHSCCDSAGVLGLCWKQHFPQFSRVFWLVEELS